MNENLKIEQISNLRKFINSAVTKTAFILSFQVRIRIREVKFEIFPKSNFYIKVTFFTINNSSYTCYKHILPYYK